MFIPLHDANSLKHIRLQYVTLGLIAANVVVYLLTALGSSGFTEAAVIGLGYIPSTVYDIAERPDEWVLVPDDLTYVTYAFLHGDIWHLGGNMLFLWVFGDNVEDALGHIRFLLFYLACAVAGAFAHGMVAPDSQAPLIGASGAISGMFAAAMVMLQQTRRYDTGRFGLLPFALVWVGISVVFGMMGGPNGENVAWIAHIGGFLAGLALVAPIMRLKRSGQKSGPEA